MVEYNKIKKRGGRRCRAHNDIEAGARASLPPPPLVSHNCHTAVGGSRRRGPDAPRASPVDGRVRCRVVAASGGDVERAIRDATSASGGEGGWTPASVESARACESLAGTRRRRRRHTWRARTVSRSGDTSVTVLSRDARVQENSATAVAADDNEQNAATRNAHAVKTNRAATAFRARLFRVALSSTPLRQPPSTQYYYIYKRARACIFIYIYIHLFTYSADLFSITVTL